MGIFLSKPQIYCADPNTGCSKKSYPYDYAQIAKEEEPAELKAFLGKSINEMTKEFPKTEDRDKYITSRCQSQFPGSVGKVGACCPDALKGDYTNLLFNEDESVTDGKMMNLGKVEGDKYEMCQNVPCVTGKYSECREECRTKGFDTILDKYGICRAAIGSLKDENAVECPELCEVGQEEQNVQEEEQNIQEQNVQEQNVQEENVQEQNVQEEQGGMEPWLIVVIILAILAVLCACGVSAILLI